jgi:hypothetical protein
MGCFGSKDKLSKEDMDFLKTHTRYDETTIKEWYKGFKVISDDMNWSESQNVEWRLAQKSASESLIDKTQKESWGGERCGRSGGAWHQPPKDSPAADPKSHEA